MSKTKTTPKPKQFRQRKITIQYADATFRASTVREGGLLMLGKDQWASFMVFIDAKGQERLRKWLNELEAGWDSERECVK